MGQCGWRMVQAEVWPEIYLVLADVRDEIAGAKGCLTSRRCRCIAISANTFKDFKRRRDVSPQYRPVFSCH